MAWLRQRERTNSPRAIQRMLDKHEWLEQAGVAGWELAKLHPNRLRYLARLGSTANPQMLRRMPPRRRYPALVAFMRQALVHITDELIDMFDRCLTETQARARRELKEYRRQAERARDDVVGAFTEIADVILNSDAEDIRRAIFRRVPRARLAALQQACVGPARPLDPEGLDFLRSRYNYIRQFSKRLLAQIEVGASDEGAAVRDAVETMDWIADTTSSVPCGGSEARCAGAVPGWPTAASSLPSTPTSSRLGTGGASAGPPSRSWGCPHRPAKRSTVSAIRCRSSKAKRVRR